MASVTSSIDYVLRQEDSRMSGEIADDPRDSGGKTRYGIAQRFHPELTLTGFFDTMPNAQALPLAESIYASQYGSPLAISSIDVQQVANALLSFAINEGVKASIQVLQNALTLPADGVIGPMTLSKVNGTSVLPLLYRAQCAHYAAIVAANPQDEAFYDGWIHRVEQDCEG